MRNVVIGFSRPNSFKIGAALIQWWMKTPYSHVYLKTYSNYTDQDLVYQASHGAVNCCTYINFLNDNKAVREFVLDIPDNDLRGTIRKAQQLLGRPYGFIGLIKLVLMRYMPFVKGDGNKTFHCSEFIDALFPRLAEKVGLPQDRVEPVHLYKILEGVNNGTNTEH